MKLITFTILFLTTLQLRADIGRFDVIKMTNNENTVYLKLWSPGVLKNHALCYYSNDGTYLNEVEFYLSRVKKSRKDSVQVYQDLTILDMRYLDERQKEGRDTFLYILKNPVNISYSQFQAEYSIADAFNGNIGGFIYTEHISNSDNYWIKNYTIEEYFSLSDDEICFMTIYGIKGNLSLKQKASLREKLKSFLKRPSRKLFFEELSYLYKKNIIMIGICSC